MRVLLVEDHITFARVIESKLNEIADCEVTWTKSRDSAEAALRSEDFDLIIIDRKIPSADNILYESEEHGFRVFQTAKEVCEGTPTWFLTGTVDPDFPVQITNNYARSEDIHGRGANDQLCMVFWKRQLDNALKEARAFAEQQRHLSSIGVNLPGGLNLSRPELKNLRIFGRRYGASSVDVTSMGGGLSGARVVKVVAKNALGGVVHTSVAKIGELSSVRDEHRRYTQDITRLQPAGFPPLSIKIEAGSGAVGGVYYSMVGGVVTSLFDKLAAGDPAANDAPAALRQMQQPWHQGGVQEEVSVGQIRRRFLVDTKLPDLEHEIQDIVRDDVEPIMLNARRCTQHNDMHAQNVLFDDQARAMVIDFNDAGSSFAAADPVTLELSLIFHKDHGALGTAWPTVDQMQQWWNLDAYVEGCAFADFVRTCRQWALATAGSEQEVIAMAYAYGLRQLRYPDTRKELARALIRGTIAILTGD